MKNTRGGVLHLVKQKSKASHIEKACFRSKWEFNENVNLQKKQIFLLLKNDISLSAFIRIPSLMKVTEILKEKRKKEVN